MGFFVMFLVSLAVTVAGELLRPKQKFDDAKPSAIGDFSFPTADQSRVIGVFWGECKLQGPNTTWFGDYSMEPINKKIKTGWFSSDVVTQGYRNYLGVQLVFAFGPVEFISFIADDKVVKITNLVETDDYYSFTMDDPTFISADEPTNGLGGPVVLYKGTTTQEGDAYLNEQWGEDETSGFRRVCYAVLKHCYIGNSETPPPFGLIARRTPNQLGMTGGKHSVNGDANIACACYEVMVDRIWGLKIPLTKIDAASFIACGNTLFDEGIGISMLVDNPLVGKDLLADMLRHADGVIYPDPVTGLYTMKLARADYDIETLVEFNDSDTEHEGFEFSRTSWQETRNTIIVNYVDREDNFQRRPVQYQDLANISVRNGTIDSESIDFLGYSNSTAALAAAARASKTRSAPLVRVQCYANRKAYDLRIGSVFKLTKVKFGLNGLVMRVIDINYGTLDDPRIMLTAIEDVFAVNGLAFDPPDPTGWTPPLSEPIALEAQGLFEMPYHALGVEQRYIGTLGAPAGPADLGYETWHDPAGGTAYVQTGRVTALTPTGLTSAEIPAAGPAIDTVGFLISSGYRLDALSSVDDNGLEAGENIALIRSAAGDEFIAWKTVVDEGAGRRISNVWRAVYDSVPLTHPAGARIWFVSEGSGALSESPYAADGTVTAKLLPYNRRGTLDLADASPVSLATVSRAWKPYPVAGPLVDGSSTAVNVSGDATITWNLRGKKAQYAASAVLAQSDPSFVAEPEDGGSIDVNVYVDGVLQRTESITSAPWDTFTYTPSMRLEDDADETKLVRFGIVSKKGAYSSAERRTQEIYMLDVLDALTITTTNLPSAEPGVPYSVQLEATGGIPPLSWTIISGLPLPEDFALSSTGLLTGNPTTEFNHPITVQAEGPAGITDTQVLNLQSSLDCADYVLPAAEGATYDLDEAEEVLPATGNEIHVCNEII